MKHILCALALSILLLAGCDDGITSGMITRKIHHAPHMYCAAYSKYGCSVWAWTQDEWVFELKDGDKTGSVEVNRSTFDHFLPEEEYR